MNKLKQKKNSFVKKAEKPAELPLGLYDVYSLGDLAGCLVHEAITHNPSAVRSALDNRKFKLDGQAIKFLVDREFEKMKRNFKMEKRLRGMH